MRKLASSDRSALIRLASTMPVGDETRRAILAGLTQTDVFKDYFDEVWDGGKKKVSNPNSKTRDKYPEVSVSTAMKDKKSSTYKQVMDGFKKWNEERKGVNKELKKDTASKAIALVDKDLKSFISENPNPKNKYSALKNMQKNYIKLQNNKKDRGALIAYVDAVESDLKELMDDVSRKKNNYSQRESLRKRVRLTLGRVIDEYSDRRPEPEPEPDWRTKF